MDSVDLKVSVIIPTYKRSDMLCQCINSVLEQTYKNIEIIVVDDNNPETEWRAETKKKLDLYRNCKNVQYICHEKNKNGSAARNTGIRNATGDLLCFLDDDDYYYPEKIRKQVDFLKTTKADACCCDYRINGREIRSECNEKLGKKILLGEGTPQTSGWMIKSSVVKKLNGFDESYYRLQDYEFLLRFLREKFVIKKLDEILYERNMSDIDNRPSGSKTEKIKEKLFVDFSDFIWQYEKEDADFKKKLYISAYTSVFKNYFKENDYRNCLRILRKCLKISVFKTILFYWKAIKAHL